jgi:hypothetical protein
VDAIVRGLGLLGQGYEDPLLVPMRHALADRRVSAFELEDLVAVALRQIRESRPSDAQRTAAFYASVLQALPDPIVDGPAKSRIAQFAKESSALALQLLPAGWMDEKLPPLPANASEKERLKRHIAVLRLHFQTVDVAFPKKNRQLGGDDNKASWADIQAIIDPTQREQYDPDLVAAAEYLFYLDSDLKFQLAGVDSTFDEPELARFVARL